RAALAADKKFWGGYYHDGGGFRYAPPALYIQIEDYSGGLRYYNWFRKNFPEAAPFPLIDFEWAIILFKRGKLKEAEAMVNSVNSQSPFLLDKFFGRSVRKEAAKTEFSRKQVDHELNQFDYSHDQENLKDFSEWMEKILKN